MTYTADTLILGVGRSTAAQIDRFFEIRGRSLAPRYAPDGTYQPAPAGIGQMIIDVARTWPQSVNHDLLAAQVVKESAAWQSEYSRHRNNPSGIGAINSDPDQALHFTTPQDGLIATIARLLAYVVGPGPWKDLAPRYEIIESRGWLGTVRKLRDLEQKWAWTPWDDYNNTSPDQRYGAGIARLANELLKVTVNEMPPSTRLIDMFDHVPEIDTSQVLSREQIANLPNFPHTPLNGVLGLTVHQTGNPRNGANAQAHRDFVANKGGAKPGYDGVSYQWTVDDTKAIQITPEDVACYHGGSWIANHDTLAFELCINADGNYYLTLYNAAYLLAVKQKQYDVDIEDKKQHNYWSGKDCPRQLRERDEWGWFLQGVEDWRDKLGNPPSLPDDEAEIKGYIVKGPILATYRELESVQEHWSTFGVPVGSEVPGVVVDDIERTVQPFDRAGWVMVEDDRGVIAKPDQQSQINREVYGTDNPADAVLREALMSIRDIVDTVIVD